MDLEKAQKIIDEAIGSEYIIFKTEDSERYTFAYYKHRNYDLDDERGHLVGSGPVVFKKQTSEHILLSSSDCIYGDYFDFREPAEEEPFQNPSFEQIKKDILRRNYVNSDDVHSIEFNWKEQCEDPFMRLHWQKEIDYNRFLIVNSKNSSFLDFLKVFWSELNLDFEMTAEDELLLCRINEKL
jgi:hypothetical protein